jgi:CBS-domain-containing membrane protein
VLPVVDGDELVGVVTDRDLVVQGMSRRADPTSARVSLAMTRHVVFCREAAPIEEAVSLMARARVRRLPVIDRERELVGVVSLADIARIDGRGMYLAAAAMRVISKPENSAKIASGGSSTETRRRDLPADTPDVCAQRLHIRQTQ